MEEKLFLTTVLSVIVYLTNYVLWNETVFVYGFVLFMLVVVIALFITVNIANECILFTCRWKTSRAYGQFQRYIFSAFLLSLGHNKTYC